MDQTFLTTDELAFRWNMSKITLIQWRWNGLGPPFHKMGRKVIYKLKEIEVFEDQRIQYNTTQVNEATLAKIRLECDVSDKEEGSDDPIDSNS